MTSQESRGQTALGLLLQHLREKRGLKLRELGQLSEVDHAYIYRLEVGDKKAPSAEVLTKLIRGLKPGKRETAMLRFLAEHADTLPEFVTLAIEDETITEEIFAAAAATAYRGSGRPDARKAIERVRRILEEKNGSHSLDVSQIARSVVDAVVAEYGNEMFLGSGYAADKALCAGIAQAIARAVELADIAVMTTRRPPLASREGAEVTTSQESREKTLVERLRIVADMETMTAQDREGMEVGEAEWSDRLSAVLNEAADALDEHANARLRAYRAMRIWKPNDEAYRAAGAVYEAAFGENAKRFGAAFTRFERAKIVVEAVAQAGAMGLSSEESDYMKVYREFWRPLVETNGALDLDKVAWELFDFHQMMDEVPIVYDHVTGGIVSKPLTHARAVIAEHDERREEACNGAVKEFAEGLKDRAEDGKVEVSEIDEELAEWK